MPAERRCSRCSFPFAVLPSLSADCMMLSSQIISALDQTFMDLCILLLSWCHVVSLLQASLCLKGHARTSLASCMPKTLSWSILMITSRLVQSSHSGKAASPCMQFLKADTSCNLLLLLQLCCRCCADEEPLTTNAQSPESKQYSTAATLGCNDLASLMLDACCISRRALETSASLNGVVLQIWACAIFNMPEEAPIVWGACRGTLQGMHAAGVAKHWAMSLRGRCLMWSSRDSSPAPITCSLPTSRCKAACPGRINLRHHQ